MQTIRGISPLIDSCAGLIAQHAFKAHTRLSPEHKRWVDPEDLLQQALLAAVKAERPGQWEASKGAKFSSYLFKALKFELSKSYTDRLRVEKRSGVVVELDAPLPGTDTTFQVPDQTESVESTHTQARRATYGFEQLCRGCSPQVRVSLVSVLLCGARPNAKELEMVAVEAMPVATKLGLRWEDLEVLQKNQKIRQQTLNQLVSSGIIGLADTDARVLECLECKGRFTLSQVADGTYHVGTSTCRSCFHKLYKSKESCFGRRKTARREGYSESDVECQLHCMDREACRQYILTRENGTMVDELEDVDFSEDKPKKSGKKAAGKSGAKKVKKAKAVVTETVTMTGEEAKWWTKYDDEAPPEQLPRWPFKLGSKMQRLFMRFVHGVSRKEYDEMMTKAGLNPAQWLKDVFEKGKHFAKNGSELRESWKLSEEGGRLKLIDLKFHGAKSEFKTDAKAKKTEAVSEEPAKKKKAKKAKA